MSAVFVGNMPFTANETEMREIFKQVGPVKAFRIPTDGEGKSKGFGFCEYFDQETAASAIRNLNGVEFQRRPLRVSYATMDSQTGGAMNSGGGSAVAPAVPRGQQLAPGMSSTNTIIQVLRTMSPQQLLAFMSEMKSMVQTNPTAAKQLLTSAPHLSYALFQAMLMMNIVDAQVLERMLGPRQQPQPPSQPQSMPHPAQAYPQPNMGYQHQQQASAPFSQPFQNQPPQHFNQNQYNQPTYGAPSNSMPTNTGNPTGIPGLPPLSAEASAIWNAVPVEQRSALVHVLSMSSMDLNALPPAQRAETMSLRQKFGVY